MEYEGSIREYATRKAPNMKLPFKHIGSVSHGTLRPEDLIPTFLGILKELAPNSYEDFVADNCFTGSQFLVGHTYTYLSGELHDSEFLAEEVDGLIDLLGNEAPPYFYFGAHPGDGSDFGFWFDSELFEQAVSDHEVLKVPAGEEWPHDYADPYDYVAEVTDHGNVTLYNTNGEELWALV